MIIIQISRCYIVVVLLPFFSLGRRLSSFSLVAMTFESSRGFSNESVTYIICLHYNAPVRFTCTCINGYWH
jgi:hypothetical protein